MVTLGFPSPIQPTNSNNKSTFSELQTQNYDLTLIQSNVSTYTRNVSSLLSAKDNYIMLAQNPNPVSITTAVTSIPFIVDKTTQDTFETYNLDSGVFTAPQSAVYTISANFIATVTAGAPTVLFLNILPSEDGIFIPLAAIPIAGFFFLNASIPLQLSTGSTLKFYLTSDVAAYTLSLSNVRLFVSWK